MAKSVTAAAELQQQQQQEPWEFCHYCTLQTFKSSTEFVKHLRDRHCTIEGGSFVCRYGYNGVCPSLPLDGVSDRDYESHVTRYHVHQTSRGPEQWSVFSAAQNLPAVLNDPTRGKQLNLFTKKWGDSFVEKVHIPPSPYLVDITYDHIEPYIKKIGRRYRRHVRLSQSHTAANQYPAATTTALASQSSSSSTQDKTFTAPSQTSLSELNDATVNDIPQIFIQPQLDLTNPTTFAEVFPGIGAPDKQHDAGRLMQEKLSHYLDIVEVQIAKQVSQKSAAFFHAMTSQDAIMEDMNAATENVRKIRDKLRKLDDRIVRKSLEIMSLERTRSNKRIILEKMKLMATVHQTQPMIQLLLGTQDYVAALDLISTTQEIVAQELIGVHCFKHLPLQLNEMEGFIDRMLTVDFEKYSSSDLNRPLTDDQDERVLEQDKLVAIISGLLRKKNFSFIDTYREEAIDTIKALIKQLVIEIIASGEAEICLTGAGEEAQSLSIAEWIVLLDRATITLLCLLRRIRSVYDVMTQICDVISGKVCGDNGFLESDVFLCDADYQRVGNKLQEMMHVICNYCHERCANLVSTQSLESTVATLEQLEKLTKIVNAFSDGCEKIAGIQSVPLKAALKIQATRFAQKFHADRKSKLALLLDSERWRPATDVPAEFQTMIDRISRGNFSILKNDEEILVSPSRVLYVDTEPYVVVGAALILVQIVSEYCRCATQLQIISVQLSWHVIDLLRMFNSRCCQLVLGAGALRVAGLTTITSGNLALVSRALQLVLWLLPHVKSHFQKFELNGTGQSISGYETIAKDFQSHIGEIENKVIGIVCSLVDKQMSTWNARPPVPSQAFRNISRHLCKLHEAIAPILPEEQVNNIYRAMHKSFKDKLRELLIKFNIVNNGGPQHGTVTSELTFYVETLRTLNVVPSEELIDDAMNDIWQK